MRVVELLAYHVRIPLRKPIRHASHTRSASDNLIVACRLEDGSRGWGEGVPREYVTGETVDTALALLRQANVFQSADFGACRDYAEAAHQIEQFKLPYPADDVRQCQGNAARCAPPICGNRTIASSTAEPLRRPQAGSFAR
jgi:L-alanine-DL-glutamate epimerase-like enolase superfamily enzyme